MSEELRVRAEAHLRRAHKVAGAPAVEGFFGHLERQELEQAADVLAAFGDLHGQLPRPFWDALVYAYENIEALGKAKLCRFRQQESEEGYVEARLVLLTSQEGGRASPVATDYRPNWDIGNRTQSGDPELNGAAITVEGALSVAPGETGIVRLHPIWPEAWTRLQVGAEILMQEGSHIVGRATVLRVKLRS